ncbi:hypothetical protein EON65_22205 [archaeon]|nr:MAG: hypothetical protein EON65_22205 [archaeon]
MSIETHPVELYLIDKACTAAGCGKLQPEVLQEAVQYLRQASVHVLYYSRIIAQHCYRSKYEPGDIEHAFVTLWDSSKGVCSELGVLSFPTPSDRQSDTDDDYDDESEEVESDEEYGTLDDSDDILLEEEQEGDEEDDDEDDDTLSRLSDDNDDSDGDDLSNIMKYLQSLGDENSLPFENREAADRYQATMVEHLRLSLRSQSW